eukprot:jgi/Tetstr1/436202/TSEL_025047.t1
MAPILRLAVRESASRHAMAFQRSISGAFAAQRAPTAALGFVRAGPLPAIEGFCGGGAAAALRTASRSVSRRHALTRSRALVISASASASAGAGGAEPGKGSEPGAAPLEASVTAIESTPETESGGGNGTGNGSGGSGGGGGGGGGDDEDGDDKLLNLAQAEEIVNAKGLQLPADFAAAAQAGGLRLSALNAWVAIQGVGIYAFISKLTPIFRDRLMADDRFLFKVLAEVAIDSGCATVAEVAKRGDDFWGEFEFYLSDLLVGLVLDVFIITCIAPVAIIGATSGGKRTGLARTVAGFPSAFFEKSIKGVREYSVWQRFGCLGQKAVQYGAAGALCGFIGQGVANQLMLLKRHHYGTTEDDVAIPPLDRTALTWGVFMAGSSNLRYQAVFGLEALVEMTPLGANRALNNALSIAIRYTNNIYGGANFIDHARFFGCQ